MFGYRARGVFIRKAWLQSTECTHGYKGLAGEHASLLLLADEDAFLKQEHLTRGLRSVHSE